MRSWSKSATTESTKSLISEADDELWPGAASPLAHAIFVEDVS